MPVGICTGIPGNFRYPNARINGEYAHVGLPRRFRRDAVIAAAEFAMAVDRIWEEYETAGQPMACTFGRFHTNSDTHSMTVVSGEFHFSLDIRAYDDEQLTDIERRLLQVLGDIEQRRKVHFDLGPRANAAVGMMDHEIQASFEHGARALKIDAMWLPSPASHDAAAFAAAGVPTAMLFVRNENGSHNPLEAMEMDDFLQASSILTWWLAANVCG
jgi:N-carbamoyl-L-amino-acid hydrolase